MKLTGAQILWECLVREGVEVIFGIGGGAVIHLFDALPQYPIRFVLVRHEQAAAHAADGYARATGKVGVCIATSGPGATNLVTGIATAYMDSSPVVAITGQVPTPVIGTDAFQETDITGITLPITKHNYLVTRVEDLPRVVKEAFHIARTGRPGPVLIDIAKDVQFQETGFSYPDQVHLPGLRLDFSDDENVQAAADLLRQARKPLILAGHGVILSGAGRELRALAERAQIPVATTLLGISAFPESHPLSLGMAGMHGFYHVNQAIQEADVLLAVGMRFDDRVTGSPSRFAPNAQIIHADIDQAEIGKNIRPAIAIVGDAREVLSKLLQLVPPATHPEWLAQIGQWREESETDNPLNENHDGHPLPQYVVRQIWEVTQGNATIVSDVGQNQMWEAQYYIHDRFNSLISSGGLGTMGFALPASIGVQIGRPHETVWVVAGDGGFQMTIQELATVVQENLPVKMAILNNGFLGMVRQWQELFFNRHYSGTRLLGPDFARVAEAYGIPGFTVREKDQVTPILRRAMEIPGPALIDFHIHSEENVYPMVAPGRAISEMIRRNSYQTV
ncbi:MAG: biosynthetic-type acetolactate synthase large subunit [Chloroflexi bacterium]|nr:biosynthetic-type acetolactate synthase large subunit [Chloroflexota bacterium]